MWLFTRPKAEAPFQQLCLGLHSLHVSDLAATISLWLDDVSHDVQYFRFYLP